MPFFAFKSVPAPEKKEAHSTLSLSDGGHLKNPVFKATALTPYLSVGIQVGGRYLQSDQILCPFVELLSNEAGLLDQQSGPNYLLFKTSQAAGHHGLSATHKQHSCLELSRFIFRNLSDHEIKVIAPPVLAPAPHTFVRAG